ncbi:MAG: TIGR04255 family protein [Methanobrevibacter sp.]|jgi:uncharacterized protein (TIGR04255 family)|nr:TIGR04255 family protein [Candidatus Methanoflexus mossambicus]
MENKYKKNYLTDVIFELKFPPVLEFMDGVNSPVSKFQKKIVDEFSYSKVDIGEELVVMPNGINSEISTSTRKKMSWVFYNESSNPTKKIILTHNSVILVYNEYNNFEEFSESINLILDALSDYPIKKSEYIGLRYINQLSFDNISDWSKLINTNLHLVTSKFVKNDILRSMHTLEFKEKDYQIQFVFGQFNSEYPNPISKKEFALDYTCRCKDSNDIIDVPKITKEMNEIIVKWFEKSILDDLREKLEVE